MRSSCLLNLAVVPLLWLSVSFAVGQQECTVTNNTGWPTAFYLGGGDVINLQNKDSTTFDCGDLKGISKRNIREQGVVANQLKALDGRTLTLEKLGANHYVVTSSEPPYPH